MFMIRLNWWYGSSIRQSWLTDAFSKAQQYQLYFNVQQILSKLTLERAYDPWLPPGNLFISHVLDHVRISLGAWLGYSRPGDVTSLESCKSVLLASLVLSGDLLK